MANLTEKLQTAFGRFQARDLAGAERLCGDVLGQDPDHPDALHLLGMVRLAAGRAEDAVALLGRALGESPRDAVLLENLGLAHLATREYGQAETVLRRALELGAVRGSLHMRLGMALSSQGKHDEAVAALGTAAERVPGDPDVHLNLGNAYAEQGRVEEAAACYHKVLALQPGHAIAHFNLGNLHRRAGRLEEAIAAFRAALMLSPNDPDIHNNLGLVYGQQQRLDDEMACYRRALELDPGHVHALNNLGNALSAQGKPAEAIAYLRRALELDTGQAPAHRDLGAAYLQMGNLEAAIACYRKAMEIEPGVARDCYSLAEACKLAGRLDEAITGYERTLALQPDHLQALNGLVHVRQHMCNWDGMEQQWERLRRGMNTATDDQVSPFSILSLPTSPAEQLACTTAWTQRQIAPFAAARIGLGFDFSGRVKKGRIRVGYLSWGLHTHATSHLAAELFGLHDRNRFEVLAYAYGPDDKSAIRSRVRNACDSFVDIARESHIGAARRIYADGVDILVDLTGYTLGARPQILALRPAPVQVNWLGYPGTLGTDCVDYIVADPFIIPPGSESHYAEKVVRLPDCYQITDRKREVSNRNLTRGECGLPEKGLVFCCFNQAYKILPETFALWMRVLKAVPGSVLWLAEANPWVAGNLRREAAARGVAGERLVFAPRKPLPDYLVQYNLADLALDTYPYTSHTTASDALWMGCPLVTCTGETFASRVAGSVLVNAGMRELVTGNFDDCERRVVELATSPDKLQDVRRRLREARDTCPLFDTPRFVRNLESAYEAMVAAQAGGKG